MSCLPYYPLTFFFPKKTSLKDLKEEMAEELESILVTLKSQHTDYDYDQ